MTGAPSAEVQLVSGITPPYTLREGYDAGLGLEQMAPRLGRGVTDYIAGTYKLYTSTEPQNPGSFREYRKRQKLERVLDTIADTVEERFHDVPEFAESFAKGTFPLDLARAFDSIVRIDANDVHVRVNNERAKDDHADGNIVIRETMFTIDNEENARLLNTVFQKLLHKNEPKDKERRAGVLHPVVESDGGSGDGELFPTVTITNVSEHDIRALGRAVDAGVWRWFREQGFRTPAEKTALGNWEKMGYTFPTDLEVPGRGGLLRFMENVIGKYHDETSISAKYNQLYAALNPEPVDREQPLGTDSSGIFQRWRNIINGLGHKLRDGTSARNLEQNPNPDDRLSLEQEARLRRDSITKEQAKIGPGKTRPLTGAEEAAEVLNERIGKAKSDKFGTAIEVARMVIGFSTIDLGLAVLARLPDGALLVGNLSKDAAEYRAKQRAFRLGRVALRNVIWCEAMRPRPAELNAAAQPSIKSTAL